MCQVSIVVSQGLNTFNNLISTSSSFVHTEREYRGRQYICIAVANLFFLFSIFFVTGFACFFSKVVRVIEIFDLPDLSIV